MGRRRLLALSRVLLALGLILPAGRARAADAVDRLVAALGTSPSYKVRVQAAALLARIKEPRAFQALGRAATEDPHPLVRVTAIKLLGANPGGDMMSAQQARIAVGRALADRDPQVRKAAAAALAQLDRSSAAARGGAPAGERRGAKTVAVGLMGDRTGRASKAFRDRMREEIRNLLGREPALQVADVAAPGVSFLVDGTIAKLDLVSGPTDVEAVCAVELVVSRPPRGIITVASGEAIVQKPRAQFRPQMRPHMEEEALQHAVRSAHENLARFLAAQ